jgi:hypothetical protein
MQQKHLEVGLLPTRLVQARNSPLGVLIGTIRDPPETTSRGSQVELSKYACKDWGILANYQHISTGSARLARMGRR